MSAFERRWLPERYCDEVCPPPRPAPSDWVVRLPGDAYAMATADYTRDPEQPDDPPWLLNDGDRIEFGWIEDHGLAEFEMGEDGNWVVSRQPPFPTDNVHVPGDVDTMAPGLEEFARNIREMGDVPFEDTIRYSCWSPAAELFEFRAGAFHPVAAPREAA